MFVYCHQLNSDVLKALDLLRQRCRKIDGYDIPLYRHLLREKHALPCRILYYQGKTLLGFLGVYFFYEDAVEIAILVSPSVRRQHIASQLFLNIRPLLEMNAIQRVIFSTPHGCMREWFLNKQYYYQHTEYEMRWPFRAVPPRIEKNSFSIREASLDDIDHLCRIDKACFPLTIEPMAARFTTLLQDSDYTLFVVEKDKMMIGKAHVFWQGNHVFLTDIGILPAMQGQGFGRALIAHCIHTILAKKEATIFLHVETNNVHALELYTRLGFAIYNAYDFWACPFKVKMNLA